MKRVFSLLILLVGLPLNAALASSDTSYYIPPSQFNAAMQVMDLGFSNIFGLFQNATGRFSFEESSKTLSHLRLAIDTTSLIANNAANQHDLAALLDVSRYPEISISSTESYSFAEGKAEIKGTLTLHGVSKPVILQATLNHIGKSPHGGGTWSSEGEAIGLSMRGTIKCADFGIGNNPDMPSRFGDTITLMLETQAVQQ